MTSLAFTFPSVSYLKSFFWSIRIAAIRLSLSLSLTHTHAPKKTLKRVEDLRVNFDDYTEAELRLIFLKFVHDAHWRLELPENEDEIDVAQVAAVRLAKNRGYGFCNGRAAENLFRMARKRATIRQLALGITDRNDERIYTLKRCDVLGERIDLDNDPLMKELTAMTGLESVKRSIRAFIMTANENFEREMRGEMPFKSGLNRVFVGSPGTGSSYLLSLPLNLLFCI